MTQRRDAPTVLGMYSTEQAGHGVSVAFGLLVTTIGGLTVALGAGDGVGMIGWLILFSGVIITARGIT